MLWCGVVLCCFVWCGLACGKPLRVQIQNASVCAFKTPPCVTGKRPHVLNMRAFSRYTRRRLERTHGRSFHLLFSLPSLVFSVFSLSNNDNDHSSRWLSLYTRPLTCLSVSVRVLWLIPCRANMITLFARNNCPGKTVQALCHLE